LVRLCTSLGPAILRRHECKSFSSKPSVGTYGVISSLASSGSSTIPAGPCV
jgi:hypothetical protein